MPDALLPLVVLACPVGMILMMLLMGRGMRGHAANERDAPDPRVEIDGLRAESARLTSRIAELEGYARETAKR